MCTVGAPSVDWAAWMISASPESQTTTCTVRSWDSKSIATLFLLRPEDMGMEGCSHPTMRQHREALLVPALDAPEQRVVHLYSLPDFLGPRSQSLDAKVRIIHLYRRPATRSPSASARRPPCSLRYRLHAGSHPTNSRRIKSACSEHHADDPRLRDLV